MSVDFTEKVIQIKRVSKKTKGGNRIAFSALVVVGDKRGRVGVGLAKALEVPAAIAKSMSLARKNLINVALFRNSIPHSVTVKEGAAKVMLKPAPPGAGIIAGGPVRAVVELAGIKDISSKILGSRNKTGNVYATLKALQSLRSRDETNKPK